TPKVFITDKLKGYLLTIILGGGILSLFIWFYNLAGTNFWIYAWIMFAAVMLFMFMFYTSLILPLFNKLTPLEDGGLRTKIEEYAKKVDFPLVNILVMDGSKRSAKANAFFSGLGSKKKIVLYDTLIKDHSDEELVAVLAHEVGHYKKKHTHQSIVLSLLQTGLTLFILSWFIDSSLLSEVLGGKEYAFHLNLLAFGLLYSPLSMIIGVLMNILSRKNEYQADRYAKETYDGSFLASALKKLSVNNLSNLNPHSWNVFLHYSHPPLLKRLEAIEGD
ncbi:M48 family metallopeptidase, partial [bacterium AH-315-C07]|nr:M48 family metallopeptidase [bacterium AH-315-C07]